MRKEYRFGFNGQEKTNEIAGAQSPEAETLRGRKMKPIWKYRGLILIIFLACMSCNKSIDVKKVIKHRYINRNDTIEEVDIIFKKGDFSSGRFLNGKKDSTWCYYNNNKLSAIKNWFVGKKFGEGYYLREDRIIYQFYSIDEKLLFNYTLKNNRLDELEGSPLFVLSKKDTVNKNEFYETLFFIPPNNPNVSYTLKVVLCPINRENCEVVFDSGIDSFLYNGRGYSKGIIEVKKAPGAYDLKFITSILFNKVIKTDSFNTELFVQTIDR